MVLGPFLMNIIQVFPTPLPTAAHPVYSRCLGPLIIQCPACHFYHGTSSSEVYACNALAGMDPRSVLEDAAATAARKTHWSAWERDSSMGMKEIDDTFSLFFAFWVSSQLIALPGSRLKPIQADSAAHGYAHHPTLVCALRHSHAHTYVHTSAGLRTGMLVHMSSH